MSVFSLFELLEAFLSCLVSLIGSASGGLSACLLSSMTVWSLLKKLESRNTRVDFFFYCCYFVKTDLFSYMNTPPFDPAAALWSPYL